MQHYCTYFDSRFLPRGLALYRSLLRHASPFVLHVLCLDDQAHDQLTAMALPSLRPMRLSDLEQADPALVEARGNRTRIEYYFTLTPVLPLHILDNVPDVEAITYLDSDLYFFASPQAIFDEMGDRSVAIIEHRYPDHLAHYLTHGRFNVGWITWRNDAQGRACLNWYRQKCLEWCHDRVEPDRYADQKYLDVWPDLFEDVAVIEHKGANLAPWNLSRYTIARRGDTVLVDQQPLLFFHFHRLRTVRSYLFDPGLDHYGVAENQTITRRIYGPYLRELRELLGLSAGGSLRLQAPRTTREVLRLVLYGRPILAAGPIATEVHAEPYARPLLRLRAATLRALGLRPPHAAA